VTTDINRPKRGITGKQILTHPDLFIVKMPDQTLDNQQLTRAAHVEGAKGV